MPANTAYRRSARQSQPRGRRGSQPKTDAVVAALTAQVLVCILLLAVAAVYRKADGEGFDAARQQYNQLVNSPVNAGELMDAFSAQGEGMQGVFASIESFISGVIDRFTGQAAQDIAPPEQGDGLTDGGPAEAPAMEFDYNYLDTSEVARIGYGMGGANPVETGGKGATGQQPPEGSTFAPVELLGKIIPPVTGLITSEFSYREHPVSGSDDFHTGMDIAAEEGRDILAALPGEVVEVGESEIYGNYIILQHAINLRTFYAHCSAIIAQEGMAVRQGERIAKVGSTGVVTGPHLHFSVIVEERYTDPYWILKDNIKLVD